MLMEVGIVAVQMATDKAVPVAETDACSGYIDSKRISQYLEQAADRKVHVSVFIYIMSKKYS